MNLKMGSKEVFELLQILDRIQVEIEYVGSFQLAIDTIRDILLDVRKFEKTNGLQSPNYQQEGANK